MLEYKKLIMDLLKSDNIMSTNEIAIELKHINAGKKVNWHMLYKHLMDLVEENKIERLKAKAGYFWKLKG